MTRLASQAEQAFPLRRWSSPASRSALQRDGGNPGIAEQTNLLALNAAIEAARPASRGAALRWWRTRCAPCRPTHKATEQIPGQHQPDPAHPGALAGHDAGQPGPDPRMCRDDPPGDRQPAPGAGEIDQVTEFLHPDRRRRRAAAAAGGGRRSAATSTRSPNTPAPTARRSRRWTTPAGAAQAGPRAQGTEPDLRLTDCKPHDRSATMALLLF